MPLVNAADDFIEPPPENTEPRLLKMLKQVAARLNGGLSLGDGSNGSRCGSFNNRWVQVTSPAVADTEFTIVVNLGRRPIGYRVCSQSEACSVYASRPPGSWSKNILYLKCSGTAVDLLLEVV